MRKIIVFIFTIFLSLSFINAMEIPSVDNSKKIYDLAEIMDESVEANLYSQISDYIETSQFDMVIITTDFTYSDDELKDFAVDFYRKNDFGLDNESGILIIRNYNQYNRYFNIYSFGDAQLYYPYERCEEILDNIYFDIKSDDYLEGFSTFISDAKRLYGSGIASGYENYYVDTNGILRKPYSVPVLPVVIISGIITAIVMWILVKKNKMVKKAETAENYADRNSINYKRSNDVFLHSHTSSYTVNTSKGSSGRSGSGFSSGGGRHG